MRGVDRTQREIDEIESLYRQHGAALLLFAQSILGDRALAQDAVHQVFVRLIEKGGLHNVVDKKAYLFTGVRNAVLNERKRRERDRPFEPDSAWFSFLPRDAVEEKSLRLALAALPEDQREVVVLHVWGGLTFSQIGEMSGVSANTAASRYRYAIGRLRDLMFAKEDSRASAR